MPYCVNSIRFSNNRSVIVDSFQQYNVLFPIFQAVKSDESEDGGETETGEDGEEGQKDKAETEKEKEEDNEEEEKKKTEPPLEDDAKKHGFLILSREDSTMVKTF